MAFVSVLASGALFFFGTGLTPIPLLTWLAPIPVLVPRLSGWKAFAAGAVAYLLGTTNSWVFYSGSHDMPLWPWGLVISIGSALAFGLSTWLFHRLRDRSPVLAALAAPAAWVSVVYLVWVSNPMGVQGTLATTQADFPLLLQVSSVTGAMGVEFLVLFIPAAIATLRLRSALIACGVGLIVVSFGAIRMSSGPTERVALVASGQKGWAADLRTDRSLLDAYVAELKALPDGVQTVVLPEAAFGSSDPATLIPPMEELAQRFTIVVGYAEWTDAKYNYALTFPGAARYLKHHDTVSPSGDSLTFAKPHVGIAICMDVNHRDPSAAYAAAGARLLAIPASDEDENGWQHSRTALLRGVENGVAIAWGGRQTNLMLADGYGRVIASKPTGSTGFTTVISDVPLGPGATVYTRFGDWFSWLCLAFTAFTLCHANGLLRGRLQKAKIVSTRRDEVA